MTTDAATTAATTTATQQSTTTQGGGATQQSTIQQNTTGQESGTTGPVTLAQDFLDWGKGKGYGDADMQKFAADPQAYKLMTSYREAEKMLGSLQAGDKIVVPKDPTDKTAWDSVYSKLGRPDSADKYQLEIPQGGDSSFGLEAGKWFHEAGLNQAQVKVLNEKWNGYVQSVNERHLADLGTNAAAEITALEKEWGPNAKVNGEVATRGLVLMGKELGLSAERVDAIRNGNNVTLSAGEAMKLFKLMGDLGKTTGDTFEGSGTGQRGTGLSMTPADAQAKLNLLQNDRAFYDRLQKKDAAAIKERDDLFKIIAGGKTI